MLAQTAICCIAYRPFLLVQMHLEPKLVCHPGPLPLYSFSELETYQVTVCDLYLSKFRDYLCQGEVPKAPPNHSDTELCIRATTVVVATVRMEHPARRVHLRCHDALNRFERSQPYSQAAFREG
jgi:hypothetical protein